MADPGLRLDLSGRVALVTGASGELGRAMVRTLAACGADVGIQFHTNRAAAVALGRELEGMGRRSAVVKADVTDRERVFALRDSVTSELGVPDIIVTSAVIQYEWTSVMSQPLEDYESQYRSCVLHNVLMAKAFVPAMAARGYGRYIGINTECSIQAFPSQSAYVSGKRGMDGLLRVLAKEVGPRGVTVNQVAPGWTVSDRDRSTGTEAQPSYDARVPLRRRGTDQEIANVVAFLASDLASYVTGAFIPVCGGNVMVGI